MAKRTRQKVPPQARPKFIFARHPGALPLVQRQLETLHQRYQRGDYVALLQAIDLFFECFSAPKWIADAFFDAMSDWFAYRAPTLDEAFRVRRSGKHIVQRRERERLRPVILLRVAQLHQQGQPIDMRTFAQVAEEIGKSPGYVSRVYYERASAVWRKILQKLQVS